MQGRPRVAPACPIPIIPREPFDRLRARAWEPYPGRWRLGFSRPGYSERWRAPRRRQSETLDAAKRTQMERAQRGGVQAKIAREEGPKGLEDP